ncbi:MAG: hypothetical protein C0475_08290 [Planctomyces sp.]|nr:hypothetical protein [Planctomyces sp.]MBA4120375.1 hypothetical protein [Isosphaera sp.]
MDGVHIGAGSVADLDELGWCHYRRSRVVGGAARPATVVGVLSARRGRRGRLMGVLCVSMPVMHGAWRRALWGAAFTAACASERSGVMARLNAHLRCISRVIVDPRDRGRGVAVGLIRAYLDGPITACTEAVASMGVCCPMFERAGMRVASVPRSAADERLIAWLAQRGVRAIDLAWPSAAAARFGASAGGLAQAERALRAWARGSVATRHAAGATVADLWRLAGGRLAAERVAYGAGEIAVGAGAAIHTDV